MATDRARGHIRFSNRPLRVKRFQTIHGYSVDVAHGLVLLFGIGTKALPSWDSRTRWNNLWVGVAVRRTVGPSGHANSPHPSSREGHHSTARWGSIFLLLDLILHGFHAAAAACSRVQRNSVPSTHTRRLPEHAWRRSKRSDGIQAVIQLHRLREVRALVGFTRFEAVTPDIAGEYETDVQRAQIALEPQWFPAVENRGEGVFVQLRPGAVKSWLTRPAVKPRLDALASGHQRWMKDRKSQRPFPGGPYVLLHTLSHLLIQSLAMRCGYPASSIRERIYADGPADRFGILLYTGSPDAEGTLGGLVQ